MQENLLNKIVEYLNLKLKITELKTKKSVADAVAFFSFYLLVSVLFILLTFFLFFLVPFLLLLYFELPMQATILAFIEGMLVLILLVSFKNKIIVYLKDKMLQILEEYAS